MMKPFFFKSFGIFASFHTNLIYLNIWSVAVSISACQNSAEMLSIPSAFPFLMLLNICLFMFSSWCYVNIQFLLIMACLVFRKMLSLSYYIYLFNSIQFLYTISLFGFFLTKEFCNVIVSFHIAIVCCCFSLISQPI